MNELETQLLPLLRGRLFHVTTPEAYRGIVEAGAIVPQPPDPAIKTWDYDCYFRGIGCVSLCDLRTIDDERLRHGLDAYYFLDPKHGNPDPVFLVIAANATQIITYAQAISRGASLGGKMIAPHIEAGYVGNLPVTLIEEVIFVEVTRPEPSPWLQALRALEDG